MQTIKLTKIFGIKKSAFADNASKAVKPVRMVKEYKSLNKKSLYQNLHRLQNLLNQEYLNKEHKKIFL